MPVPMAQTGTGNLLCKRNSKLDSFLKRNTDRSMYERIRAYEPCVVISESVNKVFMHVVLSDDCVYLTEYPPRTLTVAVSFRHIRDIELVNDLPDFLSGRDRERSQHIRVVYATKKDSGKKDNWDRGQGRQDAGPGPAPSPSPLSHRRSLVVSPPTEDGWRQSLVPQRRSGEEEEEEEEEEEVHLLKTTRSSSCPNTLGLQLTLPRILPHPPSPDLSLPSPGAPLSPAPPRHRPFWTPEVSLAPRRRSGSVLARLTKRGKAPEERDREREGEREVELHLYAVSPSSRIYLHLQSSWNSYIIRSTLLRDPLYRKRCSVAFSSSPQKQPTISWERTSHLLRQLSGELLQEGLSLESVYLLLQELHTAAHRNVTLRKLFWRCRDLCPFLVRRLEDSLQGCRRPEAPEEVHSADQLLLCTLIVQTLSLMFRETEIEPARLSMLTAQQGALPARLLLALVCEPELQSQGSGSSSPGQRQVSAPPHMEGLLAEYLDAACSLLFEMVVLCQQASRAQSLEYSLTVGWILKVLQPHPSLLSFVGYQARQVVLVLSGPRAPLSPAQASLLYQRCRVLLACLQHSPVLGQHLRTQYCEEFRYYVKASSLEEKLPSLYPISQPAQRLVSQLLGLILQRP